MRWNCSLVLLVASVGDTRVLWTFSSSTCSKRINGAVNVQQQRFQQEMFRHGNHDLTAVTAVAVDYRKSTLQKLMEHLASVTLSLRRCSRNLCQVTQVVCQMAMEMVCICSKKKTATCLCCVHQMFRRDARVIFKLISARWISIQKGSCHHVSRSYLNIFNYFVNHTCAVKV